MCFRFFSALTVLAPPMVVGTSTNAGSTMSPPVMSIVGADVSFGVSGVTTPEVRAACKTAVVQSVAVETVGPERVDCFIGLPEGMSTEPEVQASLTSQFTWTICFVVTVPEADAALVRSRLEDMSNETAPALASDLAEALGTGSAKPDLIAESFEYKGLQMVSSDGRLGSMMAQVVKEEVLVLEQLLAAGNASVTRRRGMFMAMAVKLNSSALREQGDGFFIQEMGQFDVFVPGKVFDDLQATNLILVTVYLSDMLTRFLGEETVGVNMNLFTINGANIEVTNLSQPILFNVTIEDGAEDFVCGVWMDMMDRWSTTNVIQAGTFDSSVMCGTTHLSLFGAVATGFADAFRCSQAQLLTTFGIRQLWERSWMTEVTSLFLLVIVVLFAGLMFVACVADYRRSHLGVWSDEHFLIAQGAAVTVEDPALGGLCNEEQAEGESSSVCGESIEVMRAVVRDVADECLAALCMYVEACRQAFAGLCDVIRQAWTEEGESRHGFLVLACIKLARAATERTTHLNACAQNGVHPDDPAAIEELYSSQEAGSSATLSNRLPGEQQSSVAVPAHAASTAHTIMPVPRPSVNTEDVGGRSESSMSFSGTKSEQTLIRLHSSHTAKRKEEQRKVHRIPHTLKRMAMQFLIHGPLGSIYVFSISATSKIRALLLVCELAGALAVATLFMAVSGKVRSAALNAEDCPSSSEVGAFIGRLVALGFASAVLGGLPVRLLSMLHHRKFVVMKNEGGKAWQRQLRAWQWRDAALWIFGLSYAGFSLFYVALFFANVVVVDHQSWLFSAGIVFFSELIVFPIAALMISPITLLLCIMILALVTAKSRKAVMQLVRGDDDLQATAKGENGIDDDEDVVSCKEGAPGNNGIVNVAGSNLEAALEADRFSADRTKVTSV